MTRELPNLGPAELDVLRAIWERGPSTTRQIREWLASHRPLAHASVATILKRLHQKGLVKFRKAEHGKAFVYETQHPPQHVRSSAVKRFVQRTFAGDTLSMFSALVESEPLSADQIRELRRMLNRLEAATRNASKRS